MASSRAKFVVHKTKGGWSWKLVNRGETIAASAKSWKNAAAARRGAESVANHAAAAPVKLEGE